MNETGPTKEKASIDALHALLKQVIASPGQFVHDKPLATALRSQGAMAKLSMPDRGIVSTSINTVKRHADKHISGGFQALDAARSLAHEKLEASKVLPARAHRRTKQALTEENREMKQRTGQIALDNMLLTGAIGKAIMLIREYAKKSKDGAVIVQCEKEIRDLLENFSLKRQGIFGTKMDGDNGTET